MRTKQMIQIEKLIADFEDCIGWPYASPGTDDDRGIDSAGMFVRAYRLQGRRICHNSNAIWRRYLAEKGRIHSAADLKPGMAVFRQAAAAAFSDGEGDFCHIGLVTGVSPLRIVHASAEDNRVMTDKTIGQWGYWGVLAETVPASAADSPVSADLPIDSLLRLGDRGEDIKELQRLLRSLEYDLAIDGVFGRITLECVKSCQGTHGLRRDGVIGPQTWTKLKEVSKQ